MSIPEKILDFNLAEQVENYMENQLTASRFNPRELRISENGGCARKRVLRALEYGETHPMTLADAKNFEKGRAIEAWLTDILDKLYPGEINREVIVNHPYGDPIGEGHIDIEWPAKEMLVEIKACSEEKAASGLPLKGHIDQLTSYLHFKKDEDGNRKYHFGVIIYLVLGRYGITPKDFPVFYTEEKGEALEAEMRDVWVNHVLRKDLPLVRKEAHAKGFPCYWEDRTGNEVTPHFCEFHGHCWTEDSFVDDICTSTDDPETIKLFDEYEKLKSTMKALDTEQNKFKEKKGVLEARLDRLYNAVGEKKLKAGNVEISRAQIAGRSNIDIKAAIECGVVSELALAPFKPAPSPGYSRFTVKRVKTE